MASMPSNNKDNDTLKTANTSAFSNKKKKMSIKQRKKKKGQQQEPQLQNAIATDNKETRETMEEPQQQHDELKCDYKLRRKIEIPMGPNEKTTLTRTVTTKIPLTEPFLATNDSSLISENWTDYTNQGLLGKFAEAAESKHKKRNFIEDESLKLKNTMMNDLLSKTDAELESITTVLSSSESSGMSAEDAFEMVENNLENLISTEYYKDSKNKVE